MFAGTKTLRNIVVPEYERIEYNTAFQQLYAHVLEMDNKMHIYASFMKEERVRKLIAVVCFFISSIRYFVDYYFVYRLRLRITNAPCCRRRRQSTFLT